MRKREREQERGNCNPIFFNEECVSSYRWAADKQAAALGEIDSSLVYFAV